MTLHRLSAAFAVVILACSSQSGPTTDALDQARLEARAITTGIRLTNPADHTIYYTVFEKQWATQGLFIWGPCTDAPRCPAIAPHGTITVPFAEIGGYAPGALEAMVYYWQLAPAVGGGWEATDMRSLVVPL